MGSRVASVVLFLIKSGLVLSLLAGEVDPSAPRKVLILLARRLYLHRLSFHFFRKPFHDRHDIVTPTITVRKPSLMDSSTSPSAKVARRHTIAPANLGDILNAVSGGPSSTRKPLPAEHIVSPTSPTSSSTASRPSPTADSFAVPSAPDTTAKQQKRVSVNFPIQPGTVGTRSRPQSWYGTPAPSPDIPQTPTTGTFLTALATQERRVLELKEELQKAEADLVMLKKHWTAHEASRKHDDIRRVQPLQPLNTSLANVASPIDDEDGSATWMQNEMERRKALIRGAKKSNRKVFSGSRHTRQLSLLSPDKNHVPSFPQPSDVKDGDAPVKQNNSKRRDTVDLDGQVITYNGEKYDISGLDREAIVRTGKQLAADFKEGLITFIEDLRQATVGDEAVNGTENRGSQPATAQSKSTKASGRSSGRPRPQSMFAKESQNTDAEGPTLRDIGDDFWKANGVADEEMSPRKTKKSLKAKTPKKAARKAVDESGESWETWDTPQTTRKEAPPSISDSASDNGASPISGRSSTRTSTRYV
jgi:hypothetical protein